MKGNSPSEATLRTSDRSEMSIGGGSVEIIGADGQQADPRPDQVGGEVGGLAAPRVSRSQEILFGPWAYSRAEFVKRVAWGEPRSDRMPTWNGRRRGGALRWMCGLFALLMSVAWVPALRAEGATDLRLIPFPKVVRLDPQSFRLQRRLVLEISQDQAEVLGLQISAELQLAGFDAPRIRPLKTAYHELRLSTKSRWAVKRLPARAGVLPEEYSLLVQSNAVTVTAAEPAGLFYGVQTLRQLIRANRQGNSLPAVTIRDWPSLTWRGFQDDLTRGPSTKFQNLAEQAALGSFFKLNLFTYYMEHQFAFKKHPSIGPRDGSLTGEELEALVGYARPLQVNILGNQQSFGHFTAILSHPEFAGLRETPYLLSPVREQTYQLLDDLYSETAPLLPFPYFNVCCDETDGLGEGPSKSLAARIGPGALYVQHVCRLHDLLASKYHKRMMMWGDIILRHPDQLRSIPKDTIMLSWGYEPSTSFKDQIIPFQKAGFEFLVCPGVNGWNRILPCFGAALTNIQAFVRDGAQYGAAGMLNTAWDDDGETFNAPNWHGFAWGAECAWNASTTSPDQFQRRLGAVLFGEPGDSFGTAISGLIDSGFDGLPNSTFWQFTFGLIKMRSLEAGLANWEKSLTLIRSTIAQLETCQKQALTNGALLDYYLYGARRMELCFQRDLHRVQAALDYRNARRLTLKEAAPLLEGIESTLRADRNEYDTLRRRFAELWECENKPYGLQAPLERFREMIERYDVELQRLARVRTTAKPDRSLPTPREVGLELIEGAK